MSHTRRKGKTREQLTSDLKWFSVGRNAHPSCSRARSRCQRGHGLSHASQHHLGALRLLQPDQHGDGLDPPALRSTVRWASLRATPPLCTSASPTSHKDSGVWLCASATEGTPTPCRSPVHHLMAQEQVTSLISIFTATRFSKINKITRFKNI